ncbi:box C/D snoRNA protein [Seiridium cupressi]
MSNDPLLTSLCGICHIREPKYKCPRCGAKTCSLACVKKHKNWSSCNGERDPTVYIPAAQLRTDRGIDHDYNFLHKIQRKVDQIDKIFTEERGILPQQNQHAHPNKRARLHKGQSRGKTTLGEGLRPWARASLSRLRKLDISIEHVPYGMSRAKENKTSYNHKLRVINWQVEWLLLDSVIGPTRILSKVPDSIPIYAAFGDCQWQRLSKAEKEAEKKAQKAKMRDDEPGMQEDANERDADSLQQPWSSTWADARSIMQNPSTGRWSSTFGHENKHRNEQVIRHDKDKYRFFLGNPKDPAREAKQLVPLVATDALETILKGVEVVEFPQIFAVPTNSELPSGYVLSRPKGKPKMQGKKRKNDALVAYESDSQSDSAPLLGPIFKEDGEIGDGGDENESGPEFEFENEEQRAAFLAAYQAGRSPIADDTTSSSGSGSSDDEKSDMDVD